MGEDGAYQRPSNGHTVRSIMSYWPILLTAGAVVVSAASATTRLDNLSDRVEYIWSNGTPAESVRLARIEEKQNRIEEKQIEMTKTLERMETKIDEGYTISPETRRRLRRL